MTTSPVTEEDVRALLVAILAGYPEGLPTDAVIELTGRAMDWAAETLIAVAFLGLIQDGRLAMRWNGEEWEFRNRDAE
jgi:hypothetical protein